MLPLYKRGHALRVGAVPPAAARRRAGRRGNVAAAVPALLAAIPGAVGGAGGCCRCRPPRRRPAAARGGGRRRRRGRGGHARRRRGRDRRARDGCSSCPQCGERHAGAAGAAAAAAAGRRLRVRLPRVRPRRGPDERHGAEAGHPGQVHGRADDRRGRSHIRSGTETKVEVLLLLLLLLFSFDWVVLPLPDVRGHRVLGLRELPGWRQVPAASVQADMKPSLDPDVEASHGKAARRPQSEVLKNILMGLTMSGINPALLASYTGAIASGKRVQRWQVGIADCDG
ncbi:hypothetical protein ON010_g7409 [Phytophthora cinnamomi]|nr:hypothetical protein ON010_g7409 [Phytophthora cinnamomi]